MPNLDGINQSYNLGTQKGTISNFNINNSSQQQNENQHMVKGMFITGLGQRKN